MATDRSERLQHRILDRLDDLAHQLHYTFRQGVRIMAKLDDINDLIAKLNEATNEVAADLARLRTDLSGGVSAEGADAIIAKLSEAEARLKALGEDPVDPIP